MFCLRFSIRKDLQAVLIVTPPALQATLEEECGHLLAAFAVGLVFCLGNQITDIPNSLSGERGTQLIKQLNPVAIVLKIALLSTSVRLDQE